MGSEFVKKLGHVRVAKLMTVQPGICYRGMHKTSDRVQGEGEDEEESTVEYSASGLDRKKNQWMNEKTAREKYKDLAHREPLNQSFSTVWRFNWHRGLAKSFIFLLQILH